MKIACIIHSLDGGGAERVMASLASRLSSRHHDVTLFTLDDGSQDRHDVAPGVNRIPLNLMRESRHLWDRVSNTVHRVKKIRSGFLSQSPDVVLSFCDRTNLLALMAARNTGLPVVISERSDPSQQGLGRMGEWWRSRTYPAATTIVALTESSAAHLRNRFDVPVRVIASAVDRPPMRSDRQSAAKHKRIVGIGRLEHEKGMDRLIDAFAEVAAQAPDWSLRILGEGSLRRDLEGQTASLGLSKRVSFAGWVRPVWNELSQATIFALPSRYEGFPSALLEAMAMGVPSVAVDCESGPRAVLQDAVFAESPGGLLVANHTSSLAEGIGDMIADAERREAMGRAAPCVVERFSWKAMVDEYERVLLRAPD